MQFHTASFSRKMASLKDSMWAKKTNKPLPPPQDAKKKNDDDDDDDDSSSAGGVPLSPPAAASRPAPREKFTSDGLPVLFRSEDTAASFQQTSPYLAALLMNDTGSPCRGRQHEERELQGKGGSCWREEGEVEGAEDAREGTGGRAQEDPPGDRIPQVVLNALELLLSLRQLS